MLTLALTAALMAAAPVEDADDVDADDARQFFELRVYRNDDTAAGDRVAAFARDDLIPALNRAGVTPVGVFRPVAELNEGQSAADVYVLIPYKTLADVTRVRDALARDEAYGAAEFLSAEGPAKYARIDTSLMRAFAGMPTMQVPPQTAGGEDRVFELRTYESKTEERAAKKVDMFNAGEIDVMNEVGLAPVFYGETLIASDAPNLRYMMSGPDVKTHAANFQKFLDHPTWDRLKKDPQYAGTVSRITKTFLKPADGSQI